MRKREPLKSPVREIRTPGSVRGPLGNRRSYRDVHSVNNVPHSVPHSRIQVAKIGRSRLGFFDKARASAAHIPRFDVRGVFFFHCVRF